MPGNTLRSGCRFIETADLNGLRIDVDAQQRGKARRALADLSWLRSDDDAQVRTADPLANLVPTVPRGPADRWDERILKAWETE